MGDPELGMLHQGRPGGLQKRQDLIEVDTFLKKGGKWGEKIFRDENISSHAATGKGCLLDPPLSRAPTSR
jgi:hypothetical protein